MKTVKRNYFKLGMVVLFLVCAIGWGTRGLSAENSKVNPNDQWFTDDILGSSAPYLVYPDPTNIEDFSGTITANFSASGSYSFKGSEIEANDTVKKIAFQLNMVVIYTRNKQTEKITTKVSGRRQLFSYRRPVGKLYPPNRYIEEENISGKSTYTFQGSALSPVYWSKGLKLFCFPAQLGDQPNGGASPFIGIPVNVETQRKQLEGGEVIYNDSFSQESMVSAAIPGFGTSGTRWSRAVKANNQKLSNAALGAWVETTSTHGNSNGSYSTQLYSADGYNWELEGFFRENGEDPSRKPEGPDDIIWKGTFQLTWALGSSVPQAKMSITPAEIKEYEKWIPSPIDDDRFGQPQSLTFTAEIKAKEEGKAAPRGRIHFWLNDVSQEKGQCTNFPLQSQVEPDLRFVPKQAHLIIDPNNPRHAYTKDFVTSATVEVEAMDTGAYGKLQATCEDLGLVAEDERTGRQALMIPLDDNENKIADAWERERGILKHNLSTNEDEDNQPAKQRRNGDGYTLYEEYRGFMTLKGFVRTNPLKKDLFIYDPDGLVKEWYEPYNPAELMIHYIDPKMIKFNGVAKDPNNRWVNYNSSEDKWYAKQYALYVKHWTTMEDAVGEASWMELNDRLNDDVDPYQGFKQPLKEYYIVKIAPAKLERTLQGLDNQAVKQDTFRKMMFSTVIHEIGHALGISHHKENEETETKASIQGGVFDCAMRYTIKAEYARPDLLKDQNRFCREGEIWKKAVFGEFWDIPSHNCFGQIDVKSDP